MSESWPFSDPENLAVITIKQIVQGDGSILHVVHDEEDEGWQFLGAGDASEEDAMIVALRRMVQLDPSVGELADLPPGWRAWRSSKEEPWQRERV